MYRYLLAALTLLGYSTSSFTQEKDTSLLPMIKFNYAYQIPAGDLEERFGNNSNVGVSLIVKNKNNYQFGIQAEGIFDGDVIEPDLLGAVKNDNGHFTDSDGEPIGFTSEERGFAFFLTAAKIFPINKTNLGSGLIAQIGVGFLQHKIKLDYRGGEIHQLSDDFIKGYDRLSNGPALRQSIGYQHLGKRNLANFYIGLEITEAFTKSRRGYNYDTREKDTEARMDIYMGARAGWIIPFRKRRTDSYYYY